MHPDNIFLTLTYDDAHLESPRLNFGHFQNFMKSLREKLSRETKTTDDNYISYMVTGEYGERNKRPHWHALVFNYSPSDSVKKYKTEDFQQVYSSQTLTDLWGKGTIEFGSVTIDSASYVARYAAKKLTHGKDHEHDYHPIHNTSKGRAIGRSWIEKYYERTFTIGNVVLPNGSVSKIPRYYVDWAKTHQPLLYKHYVTQVRPKLEEFSKEKLYREEMEYLSEQLTYRGGRGYPLKRSKVEETILKTKFKRLQEYLKL